MILFPGEFSPVKANMIGTLCPTSTSEIEAREYFSSRDNLVNDAIDECVRNLVNPDQDGELLGAWLLTE